MADETAPLTGKQMEQMFKTLSQLNQEQHAMFMDGLKQFAADLRKPTDAEQVKLDKERADLERKLQARIKVAMAEEQSKAMLKKACNHAMPNGKHLWRAQVNQDGYFRPICLKCPTVLPPIKATMEQMKEGVDLEQYASIDMDMLEKWAAHTRAQEAKTA